ncbi:hypothetical protein CAUPRSCDRAFT_10659 [Caulochytrium protostelioides]|uniref:Uncharacterized protein n=1 Tax=Caulochytrium protostelioides TaxID=1555241 RepID=A0A4P9WY89_9FUNG|nr:hypothetical protein CAUPRSCDRAFT_10659 [Caulochytrium protostelioides]
MDIGGHRGTPSAVLLAWLVRVPFPDGLWRPMQNGIGVQPMRAQGFPQPAPLRQQLVRLDHLRMHDQDISHDDGQRRPEQDHACDGPRQPAEGRIPLALPRDDRAFAWRAKRGRVAPGGHGAVEIRGHVDRRRGALRRHVSEVGRLRRDRPRGQRRPLVRGGGGGRGVDWWWP